MKIAIKLFSLTIVLFFLCYQPAHETLKLRLEKAEKTLSEKSRHKLQETPLHPEFHTGAVDSTNALGYVGDAKNFTVVARPYKVTRCDQVVLVPVKRIKSFDDYCAKDDAFLTMSIYMVNILKTKDPKSLVTSMLYSNAERKPAILGGAPGCIDFAGRGGNRVAVCLSSNDEAKEILEAYEEFWNCQMGTRKVLKKYVNDTCATNQAKQNLTEISKGLNPYYSLKVPGDAEQI